MKERYKLTVEKVAYSLDECAAMLGVSKGHLFNERKRGALFVVRSGKRKILVTREELLRYLREHTEEGTQLTLF